MQSFQTIFQKRTLWLAASFLLLMLPATIPFWNIDYFLAADSPLHLWRIYELDRALRAGIFYPRWAFDLYFGYGVPLYNFYPPLAYYLAETLHVLGFSLPNAIKFTFALIVLIGGGGMFLLSRAVWQPHLKTNMQADAAGLLGAVAFVYAPYFLIDVYVRGAIAEALGLALLPLYVWSLRRLMQAPNLGGMIVASIVGAALVLSHNLTAYIVAPVIGLFVLLRSFALPARAERWRAVGFAAGAAVLALALSAFYWLPAVSELRWVYIGHAELSQAALQKTIVEYFKTIENLVQPKIFYEYPEDAFPLGAVWTLSALFGFICSLFFLKRHARFEIIFFGGVSLLVAFALTDLARPIWLSAPQLWVLQFTWRLTVLLCLSGAMAMGAFVIVVTRFARHRVLRSGALVALMLVLIATATWNLRAKPFLTAMPSAAQPQVLARYEMNSRALGMSSENEYLPASVKLVPDPYPRRVRALEDLPEALKNPPALDVALERAQPTKYVLRVNASQATPLTFRTFYYPDWHAWIDNQSVEPRPSTNLGLLTIDVPSGEHQIRLEQGALPLRDVGSIVTLSSIVFVFGSAFYDARRGGRAWRLTIAILLILVLVFLVPQTLVLAASPSNITATKIQVNDFLDLVGWQSERVAPSTWRLHLVWRVKQMTTQNLPTRLELVNAQGDVVNTRTQWARYGVGDERYWIPNEIVRDVYDLILPKQLAAGEYTLRIARGDAPFVSIGTLQLDAQNVAAPEPQLSQTVDARFGDAIQLLGYDAPPLARAHPNDRIPLTLYWRANQDVMEEYWVFVQLLDKDGTLVAQEDSLPNNGFTPPMLWTPGEIVADQHTLKLSADLLPGQYRLIVGLYRYRDLTRLPVATSQGPSEDDFVVLSEIKIPADTAFTPAQRLQIQVGPTIQLRGMTLNAITDDGTVTARASNAASAQIRVASRDTLHLALEWFAQEKIGNAYTVFIHLADANGNVVRQQDNPPVNGRYPTTIWEKGERVVDTYPLNLDDLAAGDYTLRLGMYDSNTRERLPLTSASGAQLPNREIDLARVTIVP